MLIITDVKVVLFEWYASGLMAFIALFFHEIKFSFHVRVENPCIARISALCVS